MNVRKEKGDCTIAGIQKTFTTEKRKIFLFFFVVGGVSR